MRTLVDTAGRTLGQPVMVDNKPGAGGTLRAQALQTVATDGYYTVAHILLGVFRPPYTTTINWDPVKNSRYEIDATGYVFGIVVPADSLPKT